MDANPYQPPGADVPLHGRNDWPVLMALVAGIVAWLVLEVLFGLLGPQGEWLGVLLTAATYGAAAMVVGWRCEGRVLLRCLLMIAGMALGVMGSEAVASAGLRIGSATKHASLEVAVLVSWFAVAIAGALKAAATLHRSARQREMHGR